MAEIFAVAGQDKTCERLKRNPKSFGALLSREQFPRAKKKLLLLDAIAVTVDARPDTDDRAFTGPG